MGLTGTTIHKVKPILMGDYKLAGKESTISRQIDTRLVPALKARRRGLSRVVTQSPHSIGYPFQAVIFFGV